MLSTSVILQRKAWDRETESPLAFCGLLRCCVILGNLDLRGMRGVCVERWGGDALPDRHIQSLLRGHWGEKFKLTLSHYLTVPTGVDGGIW